jgi:drug/metabolite transporter (DMT)-like permease
MNFAPIFFVLLWSTGFVGAKYGLPYADPFIFLAIRVAIAAILLLLFAVLSKAQVSLTRGEQKLSAIIGSTLHFAYLGGVFYGISRGVPAGIAATVTSLQPILVSLIGVRVLKEPITTRQIFGLFCGFTGVVTVLSPAFKSTSSMTGIGILAIFIALLGSTTATLVQKRSGGSVPLLSGTAYQYFVAAGLFLAAAMTTHGFHIEWTGKFVFALLWLVLALSVGAILLLLTLLKHGSASRVSSLLYLVPPATAVEAYFLFNEKLSSLDFMGIGLTAVGVYLVIKKV